MVVVVVMVMIRVEMVSCVLFPLVLFQHCNNDNNNSKMRHPRCVYLNNRCRYQPVTQQCLKRCLIKDDGNYMFRTIAAIIRFPSESMVVVIYRIDMATSRWDMLRDTMGHVKGH